MDILKKITPLSEDTRGAITNLLDCTGKNIKTVLFISSNKGAVRANHYHKKDTHYTYLLRGKFRYTEKDAQDPSSKKTSRIIKPGEMVVSHPNIIHAMEFLETSEIMVFTTESRDQKNYETDTVRIKIV